MMRAVLCILMAGLVPAIAAERSAPLRLETLRALASGAGLNRGKIFAIGDNRYAVARVVVDQHGREYSIRVVIDPLDKHPQ